MVSELNVSVEYSIYDDFGNASFEALHILNEAIQHFDGNSSLHCFFGERAW